jgi:alpha-D-xyloside xylohydrolase
MSSSSSSANGGRLRLPAALLTGAAVAFGAAPADAATEVDAGPISAQIGADPWALELVDRRGDPVVSELDRSDPAAAGRLGFETTTGWEHATRVVDAERTGAGYHAVLATTDPGRQIELTISAAGDGVISLDARLDGATAGIDAIGIGFAAQDGERFLGFGERSDAAARATGVVENYVSDGPYQPEEYGPIGLFAPAWGLRDGHADATYFPVPWLLSTAGYGVLIDNPETSYFRLRADSGDAWSAEVVSAPADEATAAGAPAPDHLALRFFAGPRPLGALGRMTRATGRQPAPAAPWVLGPWFQADTDETGEVAALRAADAPFSVLQTYLHYLPCGDQTGAGDQRPRTGRAHQAGLAITTYFNPMICQDYQPAYDQASAAGALTRDRLGQPYLYRYGADADQAFLVGQFDFFAHAGADAFHVLLGEAAASGYDGWMEDFGEYTPLDSVSAGGIDGTRAHNQYPTRYHCAAFDFARAQKRPIVRFQRSGWTGAARCAQVVWGGDPTTGWGFDGLRSALTQALSAGSSGVGLWGSDIGGFFALGSNSLSPELLTRWVQLGAVSPVMRTQAHGVALPPKDRPQVTDEDQLANWRRYTKLHTQLYPYLAATVRAYRKRGIPPMRQLALLHPGGGGANREDEFLLGHDLLAAPVLEPGAVTRTAYLPAGRWIDLWRSATYRGRRGDIALRRARVLRGGREATVPAPLAELPLFVRAGAVIPMLSPGVDTLAGYGRKTRRVTTLGERRDQMRLLAFPRGRSSARFYEAETLRSRESRGGWRLAIHGRRMRTYGLQASLRALRHPFAPCEVALDGHPLAARRWSFHRATGVLRARFGARDAVLEVGGDC